VFLLTLAFGLVVIAAISLSPLYARRFKLGRSTPIGCALVLAAIAVAVVAVAVPRTFGTNGRVLFLVAFLLLLVASLLLIADDESDNEDGGEPPWWPEFESGFRRHVARSQQPLKSR
jgi:4-amino-4-deoxy-L-arabinose transferase-like glycosyltransferase